MPRSRLVYSTRSGRICPHCEEPLAECRCGQPEQRSSGDGIARVRRETRGRRGKTVTTIGGLHLTDEELRALAADLKRCCGTGGAVKDGVIVIQGEHVDLLIAELKRRGHTAKQAGAGGR